MAAFALLIERRFPRTPFNRGSLHARKEKTINKSQPKGCKNKVPTLTAHRLRLLAVGRRFIALGQEGCKPP